MTNFQGIHFRTVGTRFARNATTPNNTTEHHLLLGGSGLAHTLTLALFCTSNWNTHLGVDFRSFYNISTTKSSLFRFSSISSEKINYKSTIRLGSVRWHRSCNWTHTRTLVYTLDPSHASDALLL